MRAPPNRFKDESPPVAGRRPDGARAPREHGKDEEGRWSDRPLLAGGLRALAFVVPLVASLTAAWLLARALPEPDTTLGRIGWWLAVAGISLAALFLFDRLARRLLPLAALLQLSMAFPDRAPSRLSVALRSGSTKRLQDRAVHDLEEGQQEPAEAARTILALAASLNAHDRGTRGHSERVRAYADLIAEELGLSPDERDRLRWAALLHDLGKLSVPATTLNSHEALTGEDWDALRRHPLEGARLAAPLREWLGPWALAIEQHHEHYDGTGYPYGLSGEQLSLAARIVAVADSFDAMTSVRSYSSGVSFAAARMELAEQAGTHFDPAVVRAFLNVGIGHVRWVMGPLAFFSVLPFAPGLGGLRNMVNETGRTVALGAASLIATTTLVAPLLENTPAPAEVLSEQVERPAVRPVPAPRAPAVSVPDSLLPDPALPDPALPDPALAPPAEPTPVVPATSGAPRAVASGRLAATATPPPPPNTQVTAVAPTNPPGPTTPPGPAATPDAVPTPPPAAETPPPECRTNDHANIAAKKCPPRWGHTDQRPPHAGGHQKEGAPRG